MPDILHQLIIGASAEVVYNAITTAEGLAAWWTPLTTARPEVNSVSRFAFGTAYFKEMRITALQPAELVSWECMTGFSEWVGTNISFRIHAGDRSSLLNAHPETAGQIEQLDQQSGVLLVFGHHNWRNHTPMFAECNYTWGLFLRSLKLFCETGKGRPWPDQHRNA
jgi:uncharacterized protein YndB with AHSA1/START domain